MAFESEERESGNRDQLAFPIHVLMREGYMLERGCSSLWQRLWLFKLIESSVLDKYWASHSLLQGADPEGVTPQQPAWGLHRRAE